MLKLAEFLLLIASITVFPIMIAARIVAARNTGFGHALLALLMQAVVSGLLNRFFDNPFLAALVSLLVGPAVYAMVLGTTYLRGLAISALFVIIALILLLTLGPLILGISPIGTLSAPTVTV